MDRLFASLLARNDRRVFQPSEITPPEGMDVSLRDRLLTHLQALQLLESVEGGLRVARPWRERSPLDRARTLELVGPWLREASGSGSRSEDSWRHQAEWLDRVLQFDPSSAALLDLSQRMTAEITARLEARTSSLKVLETFAGLPSGQERGLALVVDWGGTNGRAALMELKDGGQVATVAQQHVVFEHEDKTGPMEAVLGRLVHCVRAVAPPRGDVPLAFVYSFPARLSALDHAIALPLTKGWDPVGLEGSDVVTEFRAALARASLERVRVRAVANDTVAPLLLSTWRLRVRDAGARATDLGMILGTGTNLAADLGDLGIRNLESGNFAHVESVANRYDDAMDAELEEPAPGAQRFEKMISGQYLGELLRRVLQELSPDAIDGSPSPRAYDAPGSLLTRALSDWTLHRPSSSLGLLSAMIGRRSARLAAAAVVGVVAATDPRHQRPHRVAVDGTLYGKFPGYRAWMDQAFQELLGPAAKNLEVAFEDESTQAGAAVLALWAQSERVSGDDGLRDGTGK